MTTEPVVRLTDVLRFDKAANRTLLDHANFQIGPADRIGLIGPSGSGKSTMMRAIAMLDPIQSGNLLFKGERVARDGVPNYRRKIVYLFQQPSFVAGTVADNFRLPFSFHSNDSNLDLARIESWLERLGKPIAFLKQTVDRLSGGERQIVALLRTLTISPQVLLLDEPTSGLDPETTTRVEHLVQQWTESNDSRAYVWSSHDSQQIERMTTKQFKMSNGRVSEVTLQRMHGESRTDGDD